MTATSRIRILFLLMGGVMLTYALNMAFYYAVGRPTLTAADAPLMAVALASALLGPVFLVSAWMD